MQNNNAIIMHKYLLIFIKPMKHFRDYLQQIIASPSISAFDSGLDQSNLPLINLLAQWFEELGCKITVSPVPGTRNKYNLLAQIGQGQGGLLLAGHTDTVPFDQGRWQYDPFALTEDQHKLFGLGVCDMKSFFAFILEVMATVPLNKLNKPLYILASADEETSMAGARFFSQQQLIKPDMAVIGEPTGLVPVRQHKGHMGWQLSAQGKAGHSSDPSKGSNAIEMIHQAIGGLLNLQSQLTRQYQDSSFAVPESTLNLGHIHGGDGENRICGHCRLTFDIRPIPALPDREVLDLLQTHLAPVQKAFPGHITYEQLYASTPGFSCAQEADLVKLAEELTGFSATSANYCTEAPFLSAMGCDTLVLGPGNIEQAHQPDEYLSLDRIKPTFQLLTQLIHRVCLSTT